MASKFKKTDAATPSSEKHALPMRLWLAAPEWSFRALGAAICIVYVSYRAQKYWQNDFWQLGPFYNFADGRSIHMPWVPVLVDLTFVWIALSFCFRIPARHRAANGWIVAFTLFTAFTPLIPISLQPLLGMVNTSWQTAYVDFLWRSPLTLPDMLVGGLLISFGNLLDLWGYAVLTRSFSIVPESRELKTSGPYRFVRHPVYLGQFIAQGGVWLFFASLHWVWFAFYFVFVVMQLYRSKLEDRVLAAEFGESYRQWQQRTFWFV